MSSSDVETVGRLLNHLCFQGGGYLTVSCSYITPRKIMFPLFTNMPPEHCLRCLLSLSCLLAVRFH